MSPLIGISCPLPELSGLGHSPGPPVSCWGGVWALQGPADVLEGAEPGDPAPPELVHPRGAGLRGRPVCAHPLICSALHSPGLRQRRQNGLGCRTLMGLFSHTPSPPNSQGPKLCQGITSRNKSNLLKSLAGRNIRILFQRVSENIILQCEGRSDERTRGFLRRVGNTKLHQDKN